MQWCTADKVPLINKLHRTHASTSDFYTGKKCLLIASVTFPITEVRVIHWLVQAIVFSDIIVSNNMDYETERMLDDIKNEIYCELDELRSRQSCAYSDISVNQSSDSVMSNKVNPRKDWQEYWAK